MHVFHISSIAYFYLLNHNFLTCAKAEIKDLTVCFVEGSAPIFHGGPTNSLQSDIFGGPGILVFINQMTILLYMLWLICLLQK